LAVQTNISTHHAIAPDRVSFRWIYIAIGVVVFVNLAMLLAFQHYLAGNFPFQDEIGYVNKLRELPETGFRHYFFDRYWTYYMPSYFLIWYGFYKFVHLNIMAVRYAGALVSALTGLLLSVLLVRKTQHFGFFTILAILVAPFVICSYNFWANYDQSMEALTEPLIFGLVLGLIWIAEEFFKAVDSDEKMRQGASWAVLGTVVWVFAAGIYPPPLVVPLAVAIARLLLRRRIDVATAVLGVLGIALPLLYVLLGQGLKTGFSASNSGFGLNDLLHATTAAVALSGNALFSPGTSLAEVLPWLLGAGLVLGQLACAIYTLRLPSAQRSRFFIPLTLMIYNALVLLEIIASRLNYPGLDFTPRYAIFGLAGPVSLLLWLALLDDRVRWRSALAIGTLAMCVGGVCMADRNQIRQLPYARAAFDRVRSTMMSLQAPPNAEQQAAMFVNPPMAPYVYPDVQFLRAEHLAMYKDGYVATSLPPPPTGASTGALLVTRFGPNNIRAQTPFNVQATGDSAMWLMVDRPLKGEVYVMVDGTRLPTFHHDNLVTFALPKSKYSKPGSYPMYVISISAGTVSKSNTVEFVVH
jgi:hypothetical protein